MKNLAAKNYSKQSISGYGNALKYFGRYLSESGTNQVSDVTYEHLCLYRQYLQEKGLALATVDVYLRSIRGLFNYLEKTGQIFLNPVDKLTTPNYKRGLMPVPSEKEVKLLLMQPDQATKTGIRDRAIIEMLYSSGARLSELTGMDTWHVNIRQGCARIFGKGKKERIVPLGKQAVLWIKIYLKDARPQLRNIRLDERALWLGGRGGRLHPQIIQRLLQEYSLKAKISPTITVHSLRRACATHMLQNGAHPVQIQLLLGHATLETLGQYLEATIVDLHKMHKSSRPGK
ncbi:MAG: tyrosine-type recombinase/integrase [Fibrobacteria bacterium]|nr:tyrosine-type recombinase/integrase [Fibrobacteria bacterium]